MVILTFLKKTAKHCFLNVFEQHKELVRKAGSHELKTHVPFLNRMKEAQKAGRQDIVAEFLPVGALLLIFIGRNTPSRFSQSRENCFQNEKNIDNKIQVPKRIIEI